MSHSPMLGGQVSNADTQLSQVTPIFATFQADDTITVGQVVQLDHTSNTAGKLVIPCGSTEDQSAVGIYTGRRGTGAQTTVSGAEGQDAVSGDLIEVQVYGVAQALTIDDTDVVVGSPLGPSGTAGSLHDVAFTNAVSPFVALEAGANGANTVTAVFVRCT